MIHAVRRTDLPVLLLHNIDPSWKCNEIDQAMEDVNLMKEALSGEGHPVVDLQITSPDLAAALKPFDPDEYIVLNWCEELPGYPKSDADVAAVLKSRSYAYTGSPPEVLAFSWDKAAVKNLLQKNNIATPAGRVLSSQRTDEWEYFPAIVKPSLEHCSVGVSAQAIVFDRKELRERIGYVEDVLKQPALVEDFIMGREFHVALWGNGQIEMLPPAEMDFSAFEDMRWHICTYDSKFTPGSEDFEKIEIIVPASLEESEYLKLMQTVHWAYRLFGCRDYARIDLRLQDDIFYVLDINPNADLSPDTSMIYAAQSKGITYGEFVSRLVNLAAQRHVIFRASE
ncbi:MAG: hypothetical protein JXA41_04155 [Deltaproteobacteria bacterium]|nr:hypothetical protein [Deltaproteobacteria bacterium]